MVNKPTASLNTENSKFSAVIKVFSMNLTINCHRLVFLIVAHDVLCEVRTECYVDLLVFRALLSLTPTAVS
jgi:hypothetical protein